MQNPENERGNNRNNNSWSTVKRKQRRKPKNIQSDKNGEQKNRHTFNHKQEFNRPKQEFNRHKSVIRKKSVKIPEYVQPIPRYANSVSKNENENEQSSESPCEISDDSNIKLILQPYIKSTRKRTVRNTCPKSSNNGSHDVWEYTYFQHLLDLSSIFSKGVHKLGIETDSINFLDVFSHFIRDCSSGEINPYIETLNKNTNNQYKNFSILRNEL
jgi:hypothetical protein